MNLGCRGSGVWQQIETQRKVMEAVMALMQLAPRAVLKVARDTSR
jgi:hypothetical protein